MPEISVIYTVGFVSPKLVKTITISDEIYQKLNALKSDKESYSTLLSMLIRNNSLFILTKLRGSNDSEDKEKMLYELRCH